MTTSSLPEFILHHACVNDGMFAILSCIMDRVSCIKFIEDESSLLLNSTRP